MTTCKNCNQDFEGQFCSYCGQSADTHEINTHFLWHDIQHGLLHFDNGIFFTIKELFIRPGYSIKEFIQGKRVKHFKPLSFVIVLASFYGLLMHYFNIQSSIQFTGDIETSKVEIIKKIINWFNSHYALTSLILLPFTSLGTYWAFKKQNYNFMQHFVLNSYLTGLRIMIRILFFPFLFLLDKKDVMIIPDIIGLIYTAWALFQFFDYLPIKTRLWEILLSFFYVGILYIGLLICSIAIGVFFVNM